MRRPPPAPDVDFATYWNPFQPSPGEPGVDHVRRIRIAASTLSMPELKGLWTDTAAAVTTAARRLDLDQPVATQGHVLTPTCFLAALAVEASIWASPAGADT